MKTNCALCNKEIKIRPDKLKKNNFCSHKCHWISLKNRIKIPCSWCEKIIERVPSELKENNFCDRECYRLWQIENINGDNHPSWQGGKLRIKCDWCKKWFEKIPSQILKNNFCNQECFGKWRSIYQIGENNPNWQEGISAEPYCDVWTDKEYKESIKKRDNYECQNEWCWKTSNRLCIHHIDYNKKNCNPLNLITICQSCNARANIRRIFWQAYYNLINYRWRK